MSEFARARNSTAGILLVAAALLALLYFAARHGINEANWPRVPGSVQEIRAVFEGFGPLRSNPHMSRRAQYKVSYSVEGVEHDTWAASGIRGDSKEVVEAEARGSVSAPDFSCFVKYNPVRPEVAVANCR